MFRSSTFPATSRQVFQAAACDARLTAASTRSTGGGDDLAGRSHWGTTSVETIVARDGVALGFAHVTDVLRDRGKPSTLQRRDPGARARIRAQMRWSVGGGVTSSPSLAAI